MRKNQPCERLWEDREKGKCEDSQIEKKMVFLKKRKYQLEYSEQGEHG